ncbi:Putative cytochrome c biosynthesis ccmC-like mitochondrial protein [Dendrobium catenatum]|uniref:Cytochrome c biosynthesis ccmC-like mitochondrial protein n=1 Tax=Dendrobium catenatum TaxID=906689 RepID=A0A2I0VBB0_9ASPA|nr:Putative cytochrome c biosynthesis ccmC-like mitochondrial protein [Dendrobium catenatum]
MSILVYVAMAINSFLFTLTKRPIFLYSSETSIEMGVFSTLLTLVTGEFWGRPILDTIHVLDPRFSFVFILFLNYMVHFVFKSFMLNQILFSSIMD